MEHIGGDPDSSVEQRTATAVRPDALGSTLASVVVFGLTGTVAALGFGAVAVTVVPGHPGIVFAVAVAVAAAAASMIANRRWMPTRNDRS